MEEKENIKLEKERKKEENKKKRLAKALETKKNIDTKSKKPKNKKKPKSLTHTITSQSLNLNFKQGDLATETKKEAQVNQVNDNMKDDNKNEVIDTKKTLRLSHLSPSFNFFTNSPKPFCPQISDTISHVRNLFQTPKKDNSFIKDNIVIEKGLCFVCTHNIYRTNIGIKCQTCNRTYHVECLQKTNVFKEKFICQTCKKIS